MTREERAQRIAAIARELLTIGNDLVGEYLDRDKEIDALRTQLAAAPSGLRVAGLLRAIDEALARAADESARQAGKSAEREDLAAGEIEGLTKAADIIRAHLGEPTPEERAAAEVLALGQRYNADRETSPADYLDHIETLATEETPLDTPWEDVKTDRDRAKWIAALALCALTACDAKGGA